MRRNDCFEEYLSTPRTSESERGRMRNLRDLDVISELRAMRNEVASLRDLLTERRPTPAHDEILTRKQTADLLRVCIESITKLVRDEGLPCKRVGKEYRFLRSEVLTWLATRDDAQLEAHGCS